MIRCGPSSDTIIILSTDLRPREMSLFIAAACYARGKHKHGKLLLLFVCVFFFQHGDHYLAVHCTTYYTLSPKELNHFDAALL